MHISTLAWLVRNVQRDSILPTRLAILEIYVIFGSLALEEAAPLTHARCSTCTIRTWVPAAPSPPEAACPLCDGPLETGPSLTALVGLPFVALRPDAAQAASLERFAVRVAEVLRRRRADELQALADRERHG
jgi:hypothetical protein